MSVEAELVDVVGAPHVLTDEALTSAYGTDWTRRWASRPRCVIRPSDSAQVSAVMQCCFRHGLSVTAQGGNTGLVGGSVPVSSDAVVVSLRRLRGVGTVDAATRQVTVEAGVTIADLHAHAESSGLSYGVDLGSRDTATVGGTIATNAGGIRVVAHGDTRRQVVGLEAVLADGEVMSQLQRLPKDSAGFDVSGLLVGSEGTLGILTRARLRLVPPLPPQRTTALVGRATAEEALALLDQQDLLAAEIIVGQAMDAVCATAGLPHPLANRWPLYVLIETAEPPQLDEHADAVLDRRVWVYRERQPEAMAAMGVIHSLDVAVPLVQLTQCLEQIPELVRPYDCYIFGHLAEGNLHVQIVGAPIDDRAADDAVLSFVAAIGGSISSEHGIGRAKIDQLAKARDQVTVEAMYRVKRALDPKGLLNPGVLLT